MTPAHSDGLPSSLSTRSLIPDDSRAVFEVMARAEQHDLGEVMIEEADIIADWQRPTFDITCSTIGVFQQAKDGGTEMIGYAEHGGGDRGDACVDPEHLGRGIGTWLAHWMQQTARTAGSETVGMSVPEGSAGDRLLAALGYHTRWTSWTLELPPGATIPSRPLPDGHQVRAAESAEYRAALTVVEDAFLEWADRARSTYEEFEAVCIGRPGFEPWNLRLVVDENRDVVAVGLIIMVTDGAEGYVERLAVRQDRRGEGLAQALLVDAFAQAREHGASRSSLATDSRTGALSLYEKVGMVTTSIWVNRAVDL